MPKLLRKVLLIKKTSKVESKIETGKSTTAASNQNSKNKRKKTGRTSSSAIVWIQNSITGRWTRGRRRPGKLINVENFIDTRTKEVQPLKNTRTVSVQAPIQCTNSVLSDVTSKVQCKQKLTISKLLRSSSPGKKKKDQQSQVRQTITSCNDSINSMRDMMRKFNQTIDRRENKGC